MVGWDLCLYLGCSIRLLLNETVSSVIRDLTFQCVSTQRHRCSHAMRTQLFCMPLYTFDGSKHCVADYICIFITTSCISTISIYVQSPDFTMSSLFIVYEHNRKEQVELAGSGTCGPASSPRRPEKHDPPSCARRCGGAQCMLEVRIVPLFSLSCKKKEVLVVCRDSHYPHVCSLQIPV